MEVLGIIGLIASLVGAATSTYASYKANSDAQKYIAAAEERNQQDHQKLIDNINRETQNYAADKRQQAQDEIAQQLENQYSAPVSESQIVRSEQQTTQGNVSDDYKKAKEESDNRTQDTINTLAHLMGRVNSSNRLRMNEGIRLADMAAENDWLSNNAQMRARNAQIGAQNVMNSYNGLKALGQGIGAIGTALSLGSGALGNAAGQTAASTGSWVVDAGDTLATAGSRAVSDSLVRSIAQGAFHTPGSGANAWVKAFSGAIR